MSSAIANSFRVIPSPLNRLTFSNLQFVEISIVPSGPLDLNPEPFDRPVFEITRTRQKTGNHLNFMRIGSKEPCTNIYLFLKFT
jgi:hypothetical protein